MSVTSENADPVFQVVDNVLTQVLGEKSAAVILGHLENRYALTPSEFSAKIDVFARGLESILRENASFIERKILNEFCCSYASERLELVRAAGSCDFVTRMRIAMQA